MTVLREQVASLPEYWLMVCVLQSTLSATAHADRRTMWNLVELIWGENTAHQSDTCGVSDCLCDARVVFMLAAGTIRTFTASGIPRRASSPRVLLPLLRPADTDDSSIHCVWPHASPTSVACLFSTFSRRIQHMPRTDPLCYREFDTATVVRTHHGHFNTQKALHPSPRANW